MYENYTKQAEIASKKIKKILECLIRIFLVCIGTSGIVEIIISCALARIDIKGIMIFACVISSVYVIIMYTRLVSWYMCAIPLGMVALFGIIKYRLVIDGCAGIVNDILQVAKDTYNIDYGTVIIGGYDGSVYNNSRVAFLIMFSGIIAFFVAVCVVHVHNMIGSIFTVIPFVVLFGVFNIMPDVVSIVLCSMFIFGVMAINRKGTFVQTSIVTLLCVAVAYLCISFVPEDRFERAEIFNKSNTMAQKSFDNIMDSGIFGSVVANGGINNGKLGKVDKIQYSGDKLLTLTTANTGKNQYFPDFIGRDYVDNSWTDDNIDAQTNITDDIVKFMEKYEGIRDYVAGENGDFYKIVDKFKYTMSYENTDKIRADSIYNINVDSFGVFSNIFSENADLTNLVYSKNGTSREELSVYNPYNIIKAKEKRYRKDVYEQYLDVPQNIQDVIHSLLGDVHCDTTKEREDYINRIRDYLKDNYEYTSSPGKVPSNKDFITYFLTESKKGYCTYFASSAVMMLRSAGIPSRYIEGYALTASQIQKGVVGNGNIERFVDETSQELFEYSTRTLSVTDRSAHAWVEAYIDGFGWVTVEVTPGSASFGVSSLDLPQAIVQKDENTQDLSKDNIDNDEEDKNTSEAETETENVIEQDKVNTESSSVENISNEQESVSDTGVNKKIFVIIMIIVIILIVIAVILLINVMRKKKLQKYIDNTDVISMYSYLENVLSKYGFKRENGMDYMEYANMLDENNEICHRHNIVNIMNCVLKNRFATSKSLLDESTKNDNIKNIMAMKAIVDELSSKNK